MTAKVLVWFIGVLFVAYGMAFTLAPMEMSNLVTGDVPATPSGVVEMSITGTATSPVLRGESSPHNQQLTCYLAGRLFVTQSKTMLSES